MSPVCGGCEIPLITTKHKTKCTKLNQKKKSSERTNDIHLISEKRLMIIVLHYPPLLRFTKYYNTNYGSIDRLILFSTDESEI